MNDEYAYQINKKDYDRLPANLALRFGVLTDALQAANQATPWREGAVWTIPFVIDPLEGLGTYLYDFAAAPRTLEEIIQLSPSDFNVADAAGHAVVPAFWNTGHVTAAQLWFHWLNRDFRAWQLANGAQVEEWTHAADRNAPRGRLGVTIKALVSKSQSSGELSPPLGLYYPQPFWIGPRMIRPSAPPLEQPPPPPLPPAPAAPPDRPGPSLNPGAPPMPSWRPFPFDNPAPNPIDVGPSSLVAMRRLISEIAHYWTMLSDRAASRKHCCEAVFSVYSSARAIAGLVELLANRWKGSSTRDAIIRDQYLDRLKSATGAFYAQLRLKVQTLDPAASVAPDIRTAVAIYATDLRTALREPSNVEVVRAFCDDPHVSSGTKSLHLLLLSAALDGALSEAVNDPGSIDELTQMVESARSELPQPRSSVLSAASAAMTLITASAGNIPNAGGADTIKLALLKTWGVLATMKAVRSHTMADRLEPILSDALVSAFPLSDEEANKFRGLLRRMRVENAFNTLRPNAPNDAIEAHKDVVNFLNEKYKTVQSGLALNLAMTIVSILQLVVVLSKSDDPDDASIERGVSILGAALPVAGSVIGLIGQQKVDAVRFKTQLAAIDWFAEKLGRVVTPASAIMSIVQSAMSIDQEWKKLDHGDSDTIVVQGVQVLSGIAIALGCIESISMGGLLGPVGAALAFLADGIALVQAAHEALRPMPSRYFRALFDDLSEKRLPITGTPRVIERLGLVAEVEAIRRAVQWIDSERVESDVFDLIKTDDNPAWSRTHTASYVAAIQKLRELGFGADDAAALVEDDISSFYVHPPGQGPVGPHL